MAGTLTREQVVAHYWPYDGPHDADTITTAADAVAGLLRDLSSATLVRGNLPAPDMYLLLGVLDERLGRLHQLTRWLGGTVESYSQDSTLRTARNRDDHPRAQLAANHAAQALDRLPARLADMHAALDDARGHLAHLYHDTNEAEGR